MNYFVDLRRGFISNILERWIQQRTQWRCINGPFRGLRYKAEVGGNALPAKLLGMYEKELHPWWNRLANQPFDLFIDIGACEGYYACGLAMQHPKATIIAFEMNHGSRESLQELCKLNGLKDRMEIHGECTVAELQLLASRVQGKRVLVLTDVEGAEGFLLDPIAVPWLKSASIVLETHDFAVAGVSAKIRAAFASSASIQEMITTDRTSADLPIWFPHWLHRWVLLVASDQRGPGGAELHAH
jgi:hypothetical protein